MPVSQYAKSTDHEMKVLDTNFHKIKYKSKVRIFLLIYLWQKNHNLEYLLQPAPKYQILFCTFITSPDIHIYSQKNHNLEYLLWLPSSSQMLRNSYISKFRYPRNTYNNFGEGQMEYQVIPFMQTKSFHGTQYFIIC